MGDDFTKADIAALYFVIVLFMPAMLVMTYRRTAAFAGLLAVVGIALKLAGV